MWRLRGRAANWSWWGVGPSSPRCHIPMPVYRPTTASRRIIIAVATRGHCLTGHIREERQHTCTCRKPSTFGCFQRISDGQKLGQRELKPWQQGRRIRFLLGNDYLCHRVSPTSYHGHAPPKAVDDPVFPHTGAQVFVPFVNIIPLKIALAGRDKLDSNGGLVLACVGDAPEPAPDDAIGAASAIGRADEVLGHGEVEGGPLGMLFFVRAQQMAELIVWCAFSDSGGWCHDKY